MSSKERAPLVELPLTFWQYFDLDESDLTKIKEFLEKPPNWFKLNETFEENLALVQKTLGIGGNLLHPSVASMPSRKVPIFQEMAKQKKQLEQEALEREEKLLAEKKKGYKPKKKPTSTLKKKKKETKDEELITDIEFKFIRVDALTLISLFLASSDKLTMPSMMKLWQCALTSEAIETLCWLFSREQTVFNKLFLHINPLPALSDGSDPSLTFSSLTLPSNRLQMLTLAECGLSLNAAKSLLENVTADHHDLIYLDLYGNLLGDELIDLFTELLERYDLIEFIGMGKNQLSDLAKLEKLLELVGRRQVDQEYVAKHAERSKERNMIIEKNNKLRTLKKPEEYVFFLEELTFDEETKGRK